MTDVPVPPAAGWPGAQALAPTKPPGPSLVDRYWPDPGRDAAPVLLAGAAVAGLLGALIIPDISHHGSGVLLVFASVGGVAAAAAWPRRTPYLLTAGALCVGLLSMLILRDAPWIVALCVLAAAGLGSAALAGGRGSLAILLSSFAVPLAGLRGLPWFGRGLAAVAGARRASMWSAIRTAVVSAVLVLAFAALFASADAVFAQWMDGVVPDISTADFVPRVILFVTLAGIALAGAYLALVPPSVDKLTLPPVRTVQRWEWAVPVALVNGLIALFLAAQTAALFGGHAYVQRTTGLTYAEYVHQGFGQLTAATLLTLLVVAGAAAFAPRADARDRRLLRVLLGLLCVLTLVVVVSALHRMHVYEQAYGFTRMRVLVTAFEAWLGLLLLLVIAAGVRLRGGWLPRAAVLTGPAVLLVLALLNPDAHIAERNVERFQETGRVDWVYLNGLSADAVPALSRLPEPYRSCAIAAVDPPGILDWNLGRARAHALATPVGQLEACRSLPSG